MNQYNHIIILISAGRSPSSQLLLFMGRGELVNHGARGLDVKLRLCVHDRAVLLLPVPAHIRVLGLVFAKVVVLGLSLHDLALLLDRLCVVVEANRIVILLAHLDPTQADHLNGPVLWLAGVLALRRQVAGVLALGLADVLALDFAGVVVVVFREQDHAGVSLLPPPRVSVDDLRHVNAVGLPVFVVTNF